MLRSLCVAAAVARLVVALPVHEGIDLTVFDQAPKSSILGPSDLAVTNDVLTYDPSAAAESAAAPIINDGLSAFKKRSTSSGLVKRAPCDQLPGGFGPMSDPNTYDSFMTDQQYFDLADAAPVPSEYRLAFYDLQASTHGPGYLGHYLLPDYDTEECATFCDETLSCTAFNLYIERDPKFEPGDNQCQNPEAVSNFKCTLWGLDIGRESATNDGHFRSQFHIGITASNGYNKRHRRAEHEAHFRDPLEMPGAIIASDNSYMGSRFFEGPYNPRICAEVCLGITLFDREHPREDGSFDKCRMFNSYVLSKNAVAQGTYCAFFTRNWDRKQATNVGQYRDSDYFSVSASFVYALRDR